MLRAYCDRCGADCTEDKGACLLELGDVDETFDAEGSIEPIGLICSECVSQVRAWLKAGPTDCSACGAVGTLVQCTNDCSRRTLCCVECGCLWFLGPADPPQNGPQAA